MDFNFIIAVHAAPSTVERPSESALPPITAREYSVGSFPTRFDLELLDV